MKQQSKILIFSLITVIATGIIGIFFLGLRFIPGIIAGIVSGICVFIVLSKVNKSDSYPYWEKNEK